MFHRIGDYMQIQFRRGRLAHQRAQIADGWGIHPEEVVGIHPIRAHPSDLDEDDGEAIFAITRWARDNEFKTFPTDVQCLFDIELHSGHNFEPGPKIFRHVEWTRRLITREGLLHRLWIGDYCRLIAQEACLVWHNNVLWSAQDYAPRAVTAGDYFRVAIPARPNQDIVALRAMLRTAEDQQRDHTMFPSTPDPTSSEESRDSEETLYGPPPVLPEPEPHDQFETVCRTLVDWFCSQQLQKTEVCLHGLFGSHIGAQHLVMCSTALGDLPGSLRGFWKDCRSTKVFLHEVVPQPQPLLSQMTHFILEFCPVEAQRNANIAPVLVEHLTFGKGGAPAANCMEHIYLDRALLTIGTSWLMRIPHFGLMG